MSKRSRDWSESLSEELLESVENRREYYLALLEEGFDWREALEHIVHTIGVKEYANLCGIKSPNLINQLKPEKDIRISSLQKMVSPLDVELSFLSKEVG